MATKLTIEQFQALTRCLSFNSDHIYVYNRVTGNFDVSTRYGRGMLSINLSSIIDILRADRSMYMERARVIKEVLDSINI